METRIVKLEKNHFRVEKYKRRWDSKRKVWIFFWEEVNKTFSTKPRAEEWIRRNY